MNNKWHLYTSYAKSILRIAGCIVALLTRSVFIPAMYFLIAEILGVLEEIKDER